LGQEEIGMAMYELMAEKHNCQLENAPVDWDDYDHSGDRQYFKCSLSMIHHDGKRS
jgi:hypothetical protein